MKVYIAIKLCSTLLHNRHVHCQTHISNYGFLFYFSPKAEKGSDEKSEKISIDLSAVPQTTPSLGLTHGHDKRDLVNRGSSKRRPMSMRESLLLSKGEEVSSICLDKYDHKCLPLVP